MHANASLALFDSLQLSVDIPFALAQGGDSPTVAGTRFASPSSAEIADPRFGARVQLYGGYWDSLQIGVGGYLYVPMSSDASYTREGGLRGQPQLLVGGRSHRFVWNLAAGPELRGSTRPHQLKAGAGAAVVLGNDFAQVGPEITVATPFSKDRSLSTDSTDITAASSTAAELLLGAKLRPAGSFVLGAGAGPGLTQGLGTPTFSAVASLGYEPLPPRSSRAMRDRDGDGIADSDDACPDVAGIPSDNPERHGCPADRDGDGIVDNEDACPDLAGVASDDPEQHGCPVDSDGDGIADNEDACPNVPGTKSADPKKHGCPADRDGDGIPDREDACPDEPGVHHENPEQNGCPLAPAKTVTIETHVRFRFNQSKIDRTSEPVPTGLYADVLRAFEERPDITYIEIQGHADDVGSEDYNQALSEARAESVRQWLISQGAPADKLVARGYSFRDPAAPNDSPENRARNRRVVFVIHFKED